MSFQSREKRDPRPSCCALGEDVPVIITQPPAPGIRKQASPSPSASTSATQPSVPSAPLPESTVGVETEEWDPDEPPPSGWKAQSYNIEATHPPEPSPPQRTPIPAKPSEGPSLAPLGGSQDNGGTQEELKALDETWKSPIYAFFDTPPVIKEGAHGKLGPFVRRYVDTANAKSTSNLKIHAVKCWGPDLVRRGLAQESRQAVKEGLANVKMKDGKLTAVFKRAPGAVVSYLLVELSYTETRVECVRWVSEHMRPFTIVEDAPFLKIVRSGRPKFRIPGRHTVARDTHAVFKVVKERLKRLFQEYDGRLSFATDAWTSPNNKTLIAITIHFEYLEEPTCTLLDLMEILALQKRYVLFLERFLNRCFVY
ncbi:hypothetical protein CVT24_002213 [Panaeolus cyanescens]|uniref:DUF659 domain-containing protein n=1 Tax=Panaeolus cyanescens TaxID=181874 RepID=A0A409X037_9AGAR|nr:hypothetical protein CVT24_002213 [Panaeolus cyanescens]